MLNKRTLIGALATIIFVVAGPIAVAGPAFAGSTPVTGSTGLTFSVSNNVATVTGYSGTNTDVVIPDTYTNGTGTYTVTAIGPGAFESKQLTSVAFPANLTSIGDFAFDTNSLTSVTFPATLTSIGTFAFHNNSLTSVTFPATLTSIGASAFYTNQLTSVTFPATLTSIGTGAFASNSLTSVTFPASLTSIGAYAFAFNSLASVTFPATLTSIGANAFHINTGLGAVLFLGNAPTTITASGGSGTFGSTIPTVYYMAGSTGFESSPWNGYPVAQFAAPVLTSGLVVALASVNTAYSFQFTGSGSPAATFAVTPGTSLPVGLQLSSTGVLSGTPTGSGGAHTISVTTSNVFANSTATYSMTIQQGPVFTTDVPPVDLVAGTGYSYQFAATGYPAPTFTAVGVLPAGLALSTTGKLSGIPTTAGSYTVQVTATSGTLQPVSSSRHTVVVTAGAPTAIAVTSSAMQAARGDTITLSLTGTDVYGNPTGDLTSQAVFTSDWAADVITGSAVTFGHASTHIITARLGALVSTISIQVADPALVVTSNRGLAVTGVDAAPLSFGGTFLLILGLASLVTATRYRRRQAARQPTHNRT